MGALQLLPPETLALCVGSLIMLGHVDRAGSGKDSGDCCAGSIFGGDDCLSGIEASEETSARIGLSLKVVGWLMMCDSVLMLPFPSTTQSKSFILSATR